MSDVGMVFVFMFGGEREEARLISALGICGCVSGCVWGVSEWMMVMCEWRCDS